MDIIIPYNYKPRWYQLEYHQSKKRFKVCVFHRRAGKSKMAFNEQVRKALLKKGIYYYFLPTHKQAKAVIWDEIVKKHIPQEVIAKKNDSELTIYYRNGSIQKIAGCMNVDKHRGINTIDVVFDEYSEMNEEIWTGVIQPVLRENKGTATFIFTPKGKNHSWKLYTLAKNNPREWFTSFKNVNDTKVIPEEELREAKKMTTQLFWEQEFLCKFVDSAGSVFRRINENVYNSDEFIIDEGRQYVIGVDLAKYQNYTVLTPFCLNDFKVGKQERFNEIDWNLQKARIEAIARRYNNALIRIDATGVGDPIFEDLSRIPNLRIEPFKFTYTSKRQLLENLAILLEQGKIKIPDDEGLKNELSSIRFKLNNSGRVVIETIEGMTDDRVMSLALAVWGAKEPVKINENILDYNIYKDDYF